MPQWDLLLSLSICLSAEWRWSAHFVESIWESSIQLFVAFLSRHLTCVEVLLEDKVCWVNLGWTERHCQISKSHGSEMRLHCWVKYTDVRILSKLSGCSVWSHGYQHHEAVGWVRSSSPLLPWLQARMWLHHQVCWWHTKVNNIGQSLFFENMQQQKNRTCCSCDWSPILE